MLEIGHQRICDCPPNHANCMTAKEWAKAQVGIWEFSYDRRDIRDKSKHPAPFPVALAAQAIKLFTHEGELVLDPFVGSGTTLVAANDLVRNAVGIDLQKAYVELAESRIPPPCLVHPDVLQVAVCDEAGNAGAHVAPGTVSLVLTSPPYANLLDHKQAKKSRKGRKRKKFGGTNEQYSKDPRDLGTMEPEKFQESLTAIFWRIRPLLKEDGDVVINVSDMYSDGRRVLLHDYVIAGLRGAGFELKNMIIWNRKNLVNNIGIFGYPSNYITMGVVFEFILHFKRKA